MKLTNLVLVALMAVAISSMTVRAETAAPTEVKWVDVTKDIMSNNSEGQGWTADAEAKVFKDEAGEMLKITSKLGNIRIDLKSKKIFYLTEAGETEAKDAKIFKRSNFMIVVKTEKLKFRASLKEEVPGVVKYLEGLSARE